MRNRCKIWLKPLFSVAHPVHYPRPWGERHQHAMGQQHRAVMQATWAEFHKEMCEGTSTAKITGCTTPQKEKVCAA